MYKFMYKRKEFQVPQLTKETIDNYVEHRHVPDSFVRAVLENNLNKAFAQADLENMLQMPAIVAYVYNEIPSICWGNINKVEKWLKKEG